MNLLLFLLNIVKYKISFDKKKSISDIKNMLSDSGPIWQKFGQILSYQEELIGDELAIELQTFLVNCPIHDHEYSKQIITKMFGNKYNIDKINNDTLIGSGTIAQVYRIDEIVIKILHPNIKQDIEDANEKYNKIKNNFLFPNKLKIICDHFFISLFSQIDMEKEYNSGIIIRELLHNNINNNKPNVFIFPTMIEFATECVVMSYEESIPLTLTSRNNIDKNVLFKTCTCIIFFHLVCIHKGFIHSDMHFGNFGIRNPSSYEDMKIVVYDFGLTLDIRNLTQDLRNNIVHTLAYNDVVHLSKLLFEGIENYDYHIEKIKKKFKYENFDADCRKLIIYIALNSIDLKIDIILILLSCEKCEALYKIVSELIKTPDMGFINDIKHPPSKKEMKKGFKNFLQYNEFTVLKKLLC